MPRAELAREQAAFRVADGASQYGAEEQQVCCVQAAKTTALHGGKRQGGLNLWVRLPDTANPAQLVRDCEMRGVAIVAGDSWFPAEPTGRYLRLNFAGPNPGAFSQGVEIIGQVLRG